MQWHADPNLVGWTISNTGRRDADEELFFFFFDRPNEIIE